MKTILSIQRLSKRYGKIQAIKDLSLKVEQGQIFGILGPNGSGKTTTLSILLDLIKPDQGEFEWFGEPSHFELRKRIGSVIESPNFYPYLSAATNLRLVAAIKESGTDDIDRVLQLTGLHQRKDTKFKTFSFGMKQRLAIASALLGKPDVLILDEPTNGLDPQGIVQIRELIMMIAREGTTILLASHLLDEVQKICTHVAVLSKGTKLFDGKVSEVLAVSDSFELAGDDMEKLLKVIREHPAYQSHQVNNSFIQVYFKEKVLPGALNNWLFSQGVILSHLSERKRSLEQHFLELLQNNQ